MGSLGGLGGCWKGFGGVLEGSGGVFEGSNNYVSAKGVSGHIFVVLPHVGKPVFFNYFSKAHIFRIAVLV